MPNVLSRFIVNAIAIAIITSGIFGGIRITGDGLPTLLLTALIFGLLNMVVKPILLFLTCPLILFTFGLIVFVINGLMLYLTAFVSGLAEPLTGGQLVIDTFLWAVFGAFVMSILNVILDRVLGTNSGRGRTTVVRASAVAARQQQDLDRAFDQYVQGQNAPPASPPRGYPPNNPPDTPAEPPWNSPPDDPFRR